MPKLVGDQDMSLPVFTRPRQKPYGQLHDHHPDHSFRGVLGLWEKFKMAEVQESDSPFCWLGDPGGILLYDRDTLEWLSDQQRYRVGLFANPEPPINGRINLPWTYWPRQTALTQLYHTRKPFTYGQRPHGVAFVGGTGNRSQGSHRRMSYWSHACDLFRFGINRDPYTPEEYIRTLRLSRYGLCLRGYGTKCHREIECLAMGVVPILTPGVGLSYHNPLQLGVHYLLARSVEEVRELARSVSMEQWGRMSEAGRRWYAENASPAGILKVTLEIGDGVKEKGCNATQVTLQP